MRGSRSSRFASTPSCRVRCSKMATAPHAVVASTWTTCEGYHCGMRGVNYGDVSAYRRCKGGAGLVPALWPACAARVDESGRSTLGWKVHSSSSLAACTSRSRWMVASRLEAHRSHRRAMSTAGDPPPLGASRVCAALSRCGLKEQCRSSSSSRCAAVGAPAYASRGWRHPG